MKLINIFKTTIAALTLTTSIAQASIIVDFEASSTDVAIGDTFTVDVLATTEDAFVDSFLAFDIGFDFDESLLSFDSSVLGGSFSAPFATFYDVAGFANSFPVTVSGSDILLATLSFTAISAGDLVLDLSAGEFSSFSFIDFSVNSIDVSVSDVAVPAPAAFGLLLMAGVFMFARRKV
ncbi:MAG: cohesin domain-containing protein [Paraglaciecola sp.]|uniref:cohesin domain-containing protein n=1 Tax=Paraglaciecola sp. TaxID=1920173 RepID=UPI003298DEF8